MGRLPSESFEIGWIGCGTVILLMVPTPLESYYSAQQLLDERGGQAISQRIHPAERWLDQPGLWGRFVRQIGPIFQF